jgi:hypothetical protein
MRIPVSYNHAEFNRTLARDLGRDLPFAAARALTWTAKDIQKNSVKWIDRVFDKPTNWTRNSAFTKSATKRDMVAEVFFKDRATKGTPAGKYLLTHIRGGARPNTRWEKRLIAMGVMRSGEFAIPTEFARLDRHDNVPSGLYAKIIAQLQIGDSGIGNETAGSRRWKLSKRADRYFVSYGQTFSKRRAKANRFGGFRESSLARGIWKRDSDGDIVPLFIFVPRAPVYSSRFHWKVWAERTARERMPINFQRSAALILRRPNR